MTDTRLATVGDVIAALSAYDPTTPLRVAAQPGYPMEHHLARVVGTPDDAEGDGTPAHRPARGVARYWGTGRAPAFDRRRRPRLVVMTATFTVLAELPSAGEAAARGAGQKAGVS